MICQAPTLELAMDLIIFKKLTVIYVLAVTSNVFQDPRSETRITLVDNNWPLEDRAEHIGRQTTI
jgi:hypothetical protein